MRIGREGAEPEPGSSIAYSVSTGQRGAEREAQMKGRVDLERGREREAVSYTHLTLPTICSV
eukprot:2313795-Rhodomonas_salina.2